MLQRKLDHVHDFVFGMAQAAHILPVDLGDFRGTNIHSCSARKCFEGLVDDLLRKLNHSTTFSRFFRCRSSINARCRRCEVSSFHRGRAVTIRRKDARPGLFELRHGASFCSLNLCSFISHTACGICKKCTKFIGSASSRANRKGFQRNVRCKADLTICEVFQNRKATILVGSLNRNFVSKASTNYSRDFVCALGTCYQKTIAV
mmetsp:Transcript_3560/g.7877  ORF Transcript_3560/g.7877 Transcript_3560/m.7877 type:complete len:204 (+) Transcript_3560:1332-1943(+)